ncbi:hypothetical protein BST61_g7874 [Cercospora zeina]
MASQTSRVALIALAAAFQAASVVAQDAPTCISKPDHSNYGKNGDSWCQWDSTHFYKPAGVGCKSDADCQNVRFPYTNCKDPASISADSLLTYGKMYCTYSNGQSGPTECGISVIAPSSDVGGSGGSSSSSSSSGGGGGGGGSSSSGGSPAPDQDIFAFCRDVLSKLGYSDLNVVAGCVPAGSNPDKDGQCIYQCNSGTSCHAGADPKAYKKTNKGIPSCPGYDSAT